MAEAFTLLDTVLITTSTPTVDIQIDTYAGSYDELILEIIGLKVVTDTSGLSLRVSDDGGSSYDSGSSDYKFGRLGTGSSGTDNGSSTGGNSIDLAGSIGNDSFASLNGQIVISGYADAALLTQFRYDISYYHSGNNVFRVVGAGYRDAATAVDHVQLWPWSGNIASAKVKVIGVN
jgi:hypothetical protein